MLHFFYEIVRIVKALCNPFGLSVSNFINARLNSLTLTWVRKCNYFVWLLMKKKYKYGFFSDAEILYFKTVKMSEFFWVIQNKQKIQNT